MEKEAFEEMRKWANSLSVSEKRFIKLLGKARAGNAESQQLAYLDWLNQSDEDAVPPPSAKFLHNLPTVTNRLKDLILDGLRLLHKDTNIDALLRTTLDEIAILRAKGLHTAAARQVRRAKKAALEHSRYGFALQCLQIEQETIVAAVPRDSEQELQRLHAEQAQLMVAMQQLGELRHRLAVLQTRAATLIVPRTTDALRAFLAFADDPLVQDMQRSPRYVERTVSHNILALKAMTNGTSDEMLPQLAQLLQEWNTHAEWQASEAQLLFLTCKIFQSLIFFVPHPPSELQQLLQSLPSFAGLPSEVARDFQRTLLHNQLVFTMNLGQLESLPDRIVDIDRWLAVTMDVLPEARILPLLYNCLVAEWILGDHKAARKRVRQIQALPNRQVREDIRDFAHLLQAVLLFEQGDDALDDYLLRAEKRRFKTAPRDIEFELVVLRYLERCIAQPEVQARATAELIQELEGFVQGFADRPPIMGLNELLLWARARGRGLPLRAVFEEAVQANLKAMGGEG